MSKTTFALKILLVVLCCGLVPAVWADSPQAVGDTLPVIVCEAGYEATVYAEGLSSPDGLAFDSAGQLYVAEETAGRVSRISAQGVVTPVLTDLASPEGIAFDEADNLYVVEDVPFGRLIQRTPAGITQTLASDLNAPEAVVWADGRLLVTESTLEYALTLSSTNAADYGTYVTAIDLTGTITRLITQTALVTLSLQGFPPLPVADAVFWSFSSLAVQDDGAVFVANELSEQAFTHTVTIQSIPAQISAMSQHSIFTFTLAQTQSTVTPFNDGLGVPESLRFADNDSFPLLAVEEHVSETLTKTTRQGRLSRATADGSWSPLCIGFQGIEDVAVDDVGALYVSEDDTGRIIKLVIPVTVTPTGLFGNSCG